MCAIQVASISRMDFPVAEWTMIPTCDRTLVESSSLDIYDFDHSHLRLLDNSPIMVAHAVL